MISKPNTVVYTRRLRFDALNWTQQNLKSHKIEQFYILGLKEFNYFQWYLGFNKTCIHLLAKWLACTVDFFLSLFSLCFEHCPELEKPGAIQGVACHVISFDARVFSQGMFPSPPVKQCWTKLNKPDLDFELATVELLPVGCLWVVLHCDHKLGISLGSVLCLIVSKTKQNKAEPTQKGFSADRLRLAWTLVWNAKYSFTLPFKVNF